eukprot:358375-Chlamydomonas_euryale.AAC.18
MRTYAGRVKKQPEEQRVACAPWLRHLACAGVASIVNGRIGSAVSDVHWTAEMQPGQVVGHLNSIVRTNVLQTCNAECKCAGLQHKNKWHLGCYSGTWKKEITQLVSYVDVGQHCQCRLQPTAADGLQAEACTNENAISPACTLRTSTAVSSCTATIAAPNSTAAASAMLAAPRLEAWHVFGRPGIAARTRPPFALLGLSWLP